MSVPALSETSKKVDEHLFNMKGEKVELGAPDSFRYDILTRVLDEKYDLAIQMLKDYLEEPFEYPAFRNKIQNYVYYSQEVISSIREKRDFIRTHSLTSAKVQELNEQFKRQFVSLLQALKLIEKTHHELRREDVKSTIYVVKAMWYSLILLVAVALILELMAGLMDTSISVGDAFLGDIAHFIAQKMGY